MDHPTILTVAGPGSGKTTTLVQRIAHVIDQGADPRAIVAITFTNAAAGELQKRLERDLGYCGTLHGYMLRLLKSHGSKAGLRSKVSVLDEEQTESLIDQCLKELNYKGSRQALDAAIASGPFKVWDKRSMLPEQVAASHFYRMLKQNGLMTFDALLWWGWSLITQHPGVLSGVSHLFVDEYQDSGRLDAMIYEAMRGRNRFFVGDPDQAIYGFRGATIQNILELSTDAEVKTVCLEDNYRSGERICIAAQDLIEHNANRVRKRTRAASIEQGMGSIEVLQFDDTHSELVTVANKLRAFDFKDCAVLLRTNWLVQEFTKFLTGMGIPVACKKRECRPHDWKKAKFLLAVLNDPENNLAAYWFLEAVHGTKKANEAKLKAMAGGRSINEFGLKIPKGVPVSEVPAIMGKAGISTDSITLVEDALRLAGDEPTLGEVILLLAESENAKEEHGRGVVVTTIHGAKGREWESVFLPAFEEEVFIGRKENGQVEEERRLAYVAMTRAKIRLIISHCAKRKTQWGFKPEPATPSRFIKEAGL